MQNSKLYLKAVLISLLMLPFGAFAQESSINAFSPYTFYGIGDLNTQGPASLRSMGGVGVGYRDFTQANYLNPASYSSVGRKAFLFAIGFEGANFYSKTAASQTSYNTFNFRDLSIAFPLYKKIGVSASVTPFSSVGYKVRMAETDPKILADIGSVTYDYNGSGGISQAKFGIGAEVFKNMSVGVDLIYFHGQISRRFNNDIIPTISDINYNSMQGAVIEDYSKIAVDFGVQYNIVYNTKRILTLGATYRPRIDLKPSTSRRLITANVFQDTVINSTGVSSFTLPSDFTVGLFYQTSKLGIGLDYSTQQWAGLNPQDKVNGIDFTNNQFVKAGIQYTPNPGDVRYFYKRWTYRLGFKYNDYYLKVNGQNINDKAITLGIGIPIKAQSLNFINIGAEIGQRGNTATGTYDTRQFQMVRERYFKFSIGVSLFGDDYWFQKFKYN